ncbi:TraB/GumN family protein [Flagellimonas crocea]|uniref:TraB/GumN family protein n=1 Tax=Flagellimonas crocea TaxID=3067311 RepID=UPI00296F6843|nr:TraB/GumN family protein [Muricauda sp. DH64]
MNRPKNTYSIKIPKLGTTLTLNLLFFLTATWSGVGQKTILWSVTDTINHKESILLGTFHQFGNSFVDSIPEIKNALVQSELAIFESIEDADHTRKIIAKRERSLEIEKALRKRDLKKLKRISADWKVDLYRLKPIELRWKLQQVFQEIVCSTVQPTDTWDHLDNYLVHLAKENNIALMGLESDSLQLDFIEKEFDSPTWKKERKTIRLWIDKLITESIEEGDCELAEKYRRFDLDYQLDEDCPNDILIKERNKEWLKTIPDLVKEKDCFIAVGYRHLMYQCGLIERLRANGLVVEPIDLSHHLDN